MHIVIRESYTVHTFFKQKYCNDTNKKINNFTLDCEFLCSLYFKEYNLKT